MGVVLALWQLGLKPKLGLCVLSTRLDMKHVAGGPYALTPEHPSLASPERLGGVPEFMFLCCVVFFLQRLLPFFSALFFDTGTKKQGQKKGRQPWQKTKQRTNKLKQAHPRTVLVRRNHRLRQTLHCITRGVLVFCHDEVFCGRLRPSRSLSQGPYRDRVQGPL